MHESSFATAETFSEQDFDFIIIGGGTAGLVVATRLSEDPAINVGVIEAGPAAFDEPLINIPGRLGESLGTKYDWQFETTAQPGINGRKLAWPRGKVLGGTSALNFMTWNRGCREDYDAWEALGNEGWGWDGLLPFFKKSERLTESTRAHQEEHSSYFNPENHGTEGPIHSSYSKEYSASHQYWHETLHNLGVETNKNHFAGSNVGAWTTLTSVEPESQTRCYSATGYFRPVASRPNLTVVTESCVEEILIERVGEQWVATGARFSHGGATYTAKASREIILSAGSVQSPQILELSGIGNREILEAAGIEVKVLNSSVGENLQEHMMTMVIYEISPEIQTADDFRASPELLTSAMERYKQKSEGILTILPCSVAYLPLESILTPAQIGNILCLIPQAPRFADSYSTLRHELLTKQFETGSRLGQVEYNFDTSNYSPSFVSGPGKKYATMMQMLQYPFSTGSIHIPPRHAGMGKTTVHDKPLIDPKYYQSRGGEVDFEVMLAAQDFGHKIVTTPPLSTIIVKRVFPTLPENDGEGEGDHLADWVRNHTITDWHPVGTCAMGPAPKKGEEVDAIGGGVVDARLRVHGVKGLRVVDASIMPLHVSAHIQATVYAIAEKGASMILEDYFSGGGRTRDS